MTRAVHDLSPDVSYSVTHEDDRFVFACERRTASGAVAPARFSLLLHHPAGMDPERLGFPAQPLAGSDTYVAPRRTRVREGGRNILRVSEIGAQKRFRLHGVAPPPMVAVALGAAGARVARFRTHVNRVPFAHGYRPGDVVRLGDCGEATVLEGDEERKVAATPAKLPPDTSCVVAESDAGDDDDPSILRLHVPRLDGLADAGTCVQVTSDPEPWNLTFARAGSVPAHLLGFPRGAVQWGVDGAVADGAGRRLPPFEAPHAHCLDHPDYVLMTFSESAGAALEHSRPLHPAVARHPEVIRWNRPLASVVSELGEVTPTDELSALMEVLEHVRQHASSSARTAQWKLSRLIREAEKIVDRATLASVDHTTEQMRETTYAQEELAPLFKKHLEDVLYNHIIDR